MRELVRGTVAKILNSRTLVINKGKEAGVRKGMVFEVLDKEATEIFDPETGDSLGGIDRPKIKVKTTLVEGKLSIAETFEKYTYNRGGSGTLNLSMMLAAPDYVEKVETLKAEEKEWEDLPPEKSIVKVGDPIREYRE